MKNKPIELTEQDLHMLVEDAVRVYLKENGMEEISMNQIKSGIGTVFSKNTSTKPMGLTQRLKNGYTNFKNQGKLDDLSNLKQQLEQYIDAGQLNPQMTIAQLVGGKYNGNKFGRLTGQMGNMRSQISKKGGTAY